jgi:hypothetical protein
MPAIEKPYVQLSIDEVDTVIHDPDGLYDPEFHDRYETFDAARDAALTSIEVMLDEADYDGEDHRAELERMHELLEHADSFADLQGQADFVSLLKRLVTESTIAA